MSKHKEDHKITLKQLADINNSGLDQALKWSHSDPVFEPWESGIHLKSSTSDESSEGERETQSLDDFLLDVAPNNNNRTVKPRRSSDMPYTDCDTPESLDSQRCDQRNPLMQSSTQVAQSVLSLRKTSKREDGRKQCLVLCVVITLFIILTIFAVVIFEIILRDTSSTSPAAISQSLDQAHRQTFKSRGLTVWSFGGVSNSTLVYIALLEGEHNSDLAKHVFKADSTQVWTWMRGEHFQLKEEEESSDAMQLHTLGDQVQQRGFSFTQMIPIGAIAQASMYEESPWVFSLVSIVTNAELTITTQD